MMTVLGAVSSIVSIVVFSALNYKAHRKRDRLYEETLQELKDSYHERLMEGIHQYQQKLEEIIREIKGN